MKKIIYIIVPIFLLVILCLYTSLRNNILLDKYSSQLYKIALPPETKIILQNKAVGNLYGTGEHLDFWAMIEIESALSEKELSDYYSSKENDIYSVDELGYLGLNTFYAETNYDHSKQKIEVIPTTQAQHVYDASPIFYKTNFVNNSVEQNRFIIQIKDTHYSRYFSFLD